MCNWVTNSTMYVNKNKSCIKSEKKCIYLQRLSKGKKGKESAFATLFLNGESGQFA